MNEGNKMFGAPIFGKILADMFDSKKIDELEIARLRKQRFQIDCDFDNRLKLGHGMRGAGNGSLSSTETNSEDSPSPCMPNHALPSEQEI